MLPEIKKAGIDVGVKEGFVKRVALALEHRQGRSCGITAHASVLAWDLVENINF